MDVSQFTQSEVDKLFIERVIEPVIEYLYGSSWRDIQDYWSQVVKDIFAACRDNPNGGFNLQYIDKLDNEYLYTISFKNLCKRSYKSIGDIRYGYISSFWVFDENLETVDKFSFKYQNQRDYILGYKLTSGMNINMFTKVILVKLIREFGNRELDRDPSFIRLDIDNE